MTAAYLKAPTVAHQNTPRGCNGKRQYASAAAARALFVRLPKLAAAYHCEHCGWWHVTREERKKRYSQTGMTIGDAG